MSEFMCKRCKKTLDTKLWGTGDKRLCSCKKPIYHISKINEVNK